MVAYTAALSSSGIYWFNLFLVLGIAGQEFLQPLYGISYSSSLLTAVAPTDFELVIHFAVLVQYFQCTMQCVSSHHAFVDNSVKGRKKESRLKCGKLDTWKGIR